MNQTITHSLQEDALLAARRASSIGKKGMFLNKEEPLLLSPKSSLWTVMVVITEIKQFFLPTCLASLSPFINHLIGATSHSPPLNNRRGVRGEATFIELTSLIISLLSVKGKERDKFSYYFYNLYQSTYRNNKIVGVQHVHYMYQAATPPMQSLNLSIRD